MLLQKLESRIAALLRWPIDHSEAIQVLRYQVGQGYRPHHDYVDPPKLARHRFWRVAGKEWVATKWLREFPHV